MASRAVERVCKDERGQHEEDCLSQGLSVKDGLMQDLLAALIGDSALLTAGNICTVNCVQGKLGKRLSIYVIAGSRQSPLHSVSISLM